MAIIYPLSAVAIWLFLKAVFGLGYWNLAVIPVLLSLFMLIPNAKYLFAAFTTVSAERVPVERRESLSVSTLLFALTLTGGAAGTKGDLSFCVIASSLWFAYFHIQQKTLEAAKDTEHSSTVSYTQARNCC